MDEKHTDIQDALNAGMALAQTFEINGVPAVLVPEGAKLTTFEEWAVMPHRIKAKLNLMTPDSFLKYYNEHETPESVIFCDLKNGVFAAILDYHYANAVPAFCAHRVSYVAQPTPEWIAWMKHNEKPMDQEAFAAFIENNLGDIQSPPGAEMLEIASKIVAKSEVDFKRAIRLDNGQVQLGYVETLTAHAGEKGTLTIPQKITLGLRVLRYGEPYQVEARLRYRLTESKLSLWYELVNPDRIMEAAILDVAAKIEAGLLNRDALYYGHPPT